MKAAMSIGNDSSHQVHVVDLPAACVDGFQELVHLLVAHLFSQVGQDVSQLSYTNEACHVLIKHLKAATIFFGFAWVSEAAGSIEDFTE